MHTHTHTHAGGLASAQSCVQEDYARSNFGVVYSSEGPWLDTESGLKPINRTRYCFRLVNDAKWGPQRQPCSTSSQCCRNTAKDPTFKLATLSIGVGAQEGGAAWWPASYVGPRYIAHCRAACGPSGPGQLGVVETIGFTGLAVSSHAIPVAASWQHAAASLSLPAAPPRLSPCPFYALSIYHAQTRRARQRWRHRPPSSALGSAWGTPRT